MEKREINSENGPQPAGAYSQVIEVNGVSRMLFISGRLGIGAEGSSPPDMAAQARLAWRNVGAQLESAGMTFDNLVKVTMFIPNASDIPASRPARIEALGHRKPASTDIVAGLVDPAWKIEIEAIACA